MHDFEFVVVKANGIRLKLAMAGDGPLVIFCHGWPESWYSWRHQIPAIAGAGYRVVAYDVRGYGESQSPYPIEAYTIKQLAADVVGIIDDVLERAQIGISAEMLGSALEAFDQTIQYLKDRKQFGKPIGSFQALQHRAAHMFSELELTKSSVQGALNAIDENSNDKSRYASLAKFKAGETLNLVSNEAVQMHGGVGVTDEFDIGFFLKRARVAEQIFGSSDYHLDRYAVLSEY